MTESGYTYCACRDCMDVSISSDMTKPELCLLCKDAGCEPNDGECERDLEFPNHPDDDPSHRLTAYLVISDLGERLWWSEDADHAREQHLDAFPEEPILSVKEVL